VVLHCDALTYVASRGHHIAKDSFKFRMPLIFNSPLTGRPRPLTTTWDAWAHAIEARWRESFAAAIDWRDPEGSCRFPLNVRDSCKYGSIQYAAAKDEEIFGF
jgi:hypothetical protein